MKWILTPLFPQEVNEAMNFDEIILEACQRIAAATGALVKAAGTAQRELVDSGRVKRKPSATSDDGQVSGTDSGRLHLLKRNLDKIGTLDPTRYKEPQT